MQKTIDAIYENGILRPLKPLDWLPEHRRVKVTVTTNEKPHPLDHVIGSLSDEDARELEQIIEEEFEKVDPNDWK